MRLLLLYGQKTCLLKSILFIAPLQHNQERSHDHTREGGLKGSIHTCEKKNEGSYIPLLQASRWFPFAFSLNHLKKASKQTHTHRHQCTTLPAVVFLARTTLCAMQSLSSRIVAMRASMMLSSRIARPMASWILPR